MPKVWRSAWGCPAGTLGSPRLHPPSLQQAAGSPAESVCRSRRRRVLVSRAMPEDNVWLVQRRTGVKRPALAPDQACGNSV